MRARGIAIALGSALLACAQSPKERSAIEAPAAPPATMTGEAGTMVLPSRDAGTSAAPPRACATDDDCEILRFDPATGSCCTCVLVAETRAAAAALREGCDAPKADASPLDGVCILSCLQAPRVRARCSDAGKCAVLR